MARIALLTSAMLGLAADPPPAAANPPAESVLYAFQGGTDGVEPASALIAFNGAFYGTTLSGGEFNVGTVFAVTTTGAETNLLNTGAIDSFNPNGLVRVGATLFGTAPAGGSNLCGANTECGTVFKLGLSGKPSVSYSFTKAFYAPGAPLIDVGGTLYGTVTSGGGTGCPGNFGCGAVVSVTRTGTITLLHSFTGGADGFGPWAALTDLNGTLYGTTEGGGSTANSGYGFGTVYSVTPSGAEHIVYAFKGGSDGYGPFSKLIDVNGTLYGTTIVGGGSATCYNGCGTVFSVTPAGEEKILHVFTGGADGATPRAGLVARGGALWGTTSAGGANGLGTIFRITLAGAEKVFYAFQGGKDGATPASDLVNVGGTLYGTTNYGGGATTACPAIGEIPSGCGTVFKFEP